MGMECMQQLQRGWSFSTEDSSMGLTLGFIGTIMATDGLHKHFIYL